MRTISNVTDDKPQPFPSHSVPAVITRISLANSLIRRLVRSVTPFFVSTNTEFVGRSARGAIRRRPFMLHFRPIYELWRLCRIKGNGRLVIDINHFQKLGILRWIQSHGLCLTIPN